MTLASRAASSQPRGFQCLRCRHQFDAEILQQTRLGVPHGRKPAVVKTPTGYSREGLRCPRCGSTMIHATPPHQAPENQR